MSRISQRDDLSTSNSKMLFDSVRNRFLLFVITFVIGLFLAMVYVGVIFGQQITIILLSMSPVAILFFPLGLVAYLPDDHQWAWFFSVWLFYLVSSIFGIVVKRRWFALLMYIMFIIALILNIAGCAPVILDALSGLD